MDEKNAWTITPYIVTPDKDYFDLDIREVRDDLPTSLVIHEYPYSNHNYIRNLGQKTRKIHVECSFYRNARQGPAADHVPPTYENHFNFIAAVENNSKAWEFYHPAYGIMNGYIDNLTSFQDDTKEYADISFDFHKISVAPADYADVYISSKQSEKWGATSNKVKDLLTAARKGAVSLAKWTAEATTYKNRLDTFLNSITSPVNSVIYSISYTTDLPSQVLLSINGAIDRLVTGQQTVINTPAVFINSLIVAARAFKDTYTNATEAQYVHVMSASRVALEAARVLESDEANNITLNNKSDTRTYDENGNFVDLDTVPPVLTYNELETMAYTVREFIDGAVQLDRDNRALKEQGVSLQEYINRIKLERLRIVVEQTPLQSLHQLAITKGNNYQKAEELLKLNPGIKNPTFAYGNLKVLIPSNV